MTRSASDARTRYIVLFEGRAGSSYLMDSLGRIPGVVAEGEMLVGLSRPEGSFLDRLRWLIRPSADWLIGPSAERGAAGVQLDAVRRLYSASWPGAEAVGFKTKLRDVHDLDGLGLLLRDHRVRAIVLERRNLVKQAVSHLNAQRLYDERGEWNLREGQSRLGPFVIAPGEFDAILRRLVFAHRVLDAFVDHVRVPTLHLEYADLLRDPVTWFASACRFLGLAPEPPQSVLQKNSDDDLRSLLINFDELRSIYQGTPWAEMFDESGQSVA